MGASLIHSLQEDQATSMIPAWPITQVSLRTVVFAKNARIVVGEVDLEGQFWKVVLFLYATNTILDKVEVSPEEEHHPPDIEQAGHEHTLYILLRWWWWWMIILMKRESTWVILNYLSFTQHAHFDHLGLFRSLFRLLSHFHLLQEIFIPLDPKFATDCDISPQVQAPYSWPPFLP